MSVWSESRNGITAAIVLLLLGSGCHKEVNVIEFEAARFEGDRRRYDVWLGVADMGNQDELTEPKAYTAAERKMTQYYRDSMSRACYFFRDRLAGRTRVQPYVYLAALRPRGEMFPRDCEAPCPRCFVLDVGWLAFDSDDQAIPVSKVEVGLGTPPSVVQTLANPYVAQAKLPDERVVFWCDGYRESGRWVVPKKATESTASGQVVLAMWDLTAVGESSSAAISVRAVSSNGSAGDWRQVEFFEPDAPDEEVDRSGKASPEEPR